MFMTIGSFAVVTVLGRDGDGDHDLARYRGLAGRQPVLALAFAVLLLAQAGAPFTTGLWAKVQVVFAAVEAGDVPLGVIAMVTAAVAAYFYLRVAVLMYAGGGLGEPEGGTAARPRRAPRAAWRAAAAWMATPTPSGRRRWPRRPSWATPASVAAGGDHPQRADPAGRRGARERGRAARGGAGAGAEPRWPSGCAPE